MESPPMPRNRAASPATFNPTVLTAKTVFMQRVLEAVGDGYHHWTAGTVPLGRALAMVRKFAEVYGVHLDKHARWRRRVSGLGSARVVMRLNEELDIDFALLVSEGEHAAHHLERLQDARKCP